MVIFDPFQDLDARPWDFQMEECTLRSCVDRFNNRRYLSNQTFLNAKAPSSNPHALNNVANSNFQVSSNTTNMPNQMSYSAGNVGGINNGPIGNPNVNNSLNANGSQQVLCRFYFSTMMKLYRIGISNFFSPKDFVPKQLHITNKQCQWTTVH